MRGAIESMWRRAFRVTQSFDDARMVALIEAPPPTPAPAATAAHPNPRVSSDDTRSGIKIYLATPAYSCEVHPLYMTSVLDLVRVLARAGVGVQVVPLGNESLVQRARNVITKRFLNSECTHLLFIDADIAFKADSVIRLLGADRDVVGACYAKKGIDWTNVHDGLRDGSPENVASLGIDYNFNPVSAGDVVADGFVRVLDIATGFLLIKRSVIERMYEHYAYELTCANDIPGCRDDIPEYVAIFDCMIDPESTRYLSEDYAWCRRWQYMGGEIWADIASPLMHIGTTPFSGDIRDRLEVAVSA